MRDSSLWREAPVETELADRLRHSVVFFVPDANHASGSSVLAENRVCVVCGVLLRLD